MKSPRIAFVLVSLIGLFAGRTHAQVSSTFDAGADSWTITDIGFPVVNPPTVAGVYQPDWFATGGNPGGHLSETDPSGNWFFFSAPNSYLGDKSAYYGGSFSYDLRCSGSSPLWEPGMVLVGGTSTLFYNTNPPPSGTWTNYVHSLTPSGWRLNDYVNGPEPSVEEMKSVLSNLQAVYISGDRLDGEETSGLDNVHVIPEPSSIVLLGAGGLGLLAYAWQRRRRAA